MLVPRTDHQGERPTWDCQVCGQQWPCAVAKVELAEQCQRFPHGLLIYLCSCLIEAIDDWAAGSGGPPPDLYARFLGWSDKAAPPPGDAGAPAQVTRRVGTTLIGMQEIAARLGVSRQRVQQLTVRPGFPAPVAALGMGRVWRTAEIESWVRAFRRPSSKEDECRC